jgi:regulator of sirC expression with transglutaminase-like and TPR domain
VDPRTRFEQLLHGPDASIGELALCIAECARPDVDADATRAALDALARTVRVPDLAGVIDAVCTRAGFAGDTEHYEHPRNSMIDQVVARRRGIPITLSIVVVEVGARCGVGIRPIGAPGHFLVRSAGDPDEFADPFVGAVLDRASVVAQFHRRYGAARTLGRHDLEPVSGSAVAARVLNNLEAGPLGQDLQALGWMVDLHRRIPGLGAGDRVALATRLELLGRFADAADQIDHAASAVGDDVARRLDARAAAYRARFN